MEIETKNSLNVFYDKLRIITSFINDEVYVQEIIDGLEPNIQQEFEDIMVQFVEMLEEIQDSEENGNFYLDTEMLYELIDNVLEFEPNFFGNFKYYKLLYYSILNKLGEIDEIDLEISSPAELKDYTVDIEENNFCFNEPHSDDIILLFSPNDIETNDEILSQVNIDMLFSILDKLNFDKEIPERSRLCFINDGNPLGAGGTLNKDKLKSIINLKKVALGNPIHKNFLYRKQPSLPESVFLDFHHEYQQFNDVIFILSEYNDQVSILDKYLKIYQVIENFMYRSTICKLVNASSPNMFSIRQFQNLFKKIDKNEESALKEFISIVFEEDYNNTTKFKKYLKDNWDDFFVRTNQMEVESAIESLGISIRPSNLNNDNFKTFLSKIIYYLRNSVVHNKETELHLSYGNLESYRGFQLILEEFLLAALEEIIYYLLIKKNDIVWYEDSSLVLYN